MIYAQLDDNFTVVGIAQGPAPETGEPEPGRMENNLLFLAEYDSGILGKRYNPGTGEFEDLPEPLPSLDEAKAAKKEEINGACQDIITAGVEVGTSLGTKRFSLSSQDQSNLNAYAGQVMAALAGLPSAINPELGIWYHADGEQHRYWSLEDFNAISTAAFTHITLHLTYCGNLKVYVDGLESYDEIAAVNYGMEIPAEKGE